MASKIKKSAKSKTMPGPKGRKKYPPFDEMTSDDLQRAADAEDVTQLVKWLIAVMEDMGMCDGDEDDTDDDMDDNEGDDE